MNFLDIILVILMAIGVIGGIVLLILGIIDDEIGYGILFLLSCLFFSGILSLSL